MNKHFATTLVAASALLGIAHHDAAARSSSRAIERTPAAHNAAWAGETGTASYYGNVYHGHRAANGSRFDQRLLTAAHAWLPFGTKIRVMLAGRSVIVTVTDRLYSSRRVVDLSLAAARELGMIRRGVAEVSLTPV